MLTKYILWKSTKTRLQNVSSIIQHFTRLPNFGNGYLIFNSSIIWISSYITRIETCPSSTVMRGAGWPISHQILITSLTRISIHLQLNGHPGPNARRSETRGQKYIVIIIYCQQEWMSEFPVIFIKCHLNGREINYVMLCLCYVSTPANAASLHHHK